MRSAAAALAAALLVAGCATPPPHAAQDAAVEDLAVCFLKARPARPVVDLQSLDDGARAQRIFLARLGKRRGESVGYKAALTSLAARKAMGSTTPVRGTLFEEMLLPSPSAIAIQSGVRMMAEADLVVRISSGLINKAASAEEAVHYVDAVYPFLEVPDLLYEPGTPLSAADLLAINAGARFGILGEPVAVSAREDWLARLAAFRVELLDRHGEVVSRAAGRDVMGHPLHAVLWVRDSLQAEGLQLQRGDLVSVGSLTDLKPAEPGAAYTARYLDLSPKGPVEVSVVFE